MDAQDAYKKFKQFLGEFFIRSIEGSLNKDDFDEKHLDFIRPHLENILGTLSLPEVLRIQNYFNEAAIFHMKEALGEPMNTTPISSSMAVSYDSDEQPFERRRPDEVNIQREVTQENTPQEDLGPFQRGTIGIIESTPLSVSNVTEGQVRIRVNHPEYANALDDPFVNDIMTHITLSPIPQELEEQNIFSNLNLNTLSDPVQSSNRNTEENEHPFLRKFAHMENGNAKKVKVIRKSHQHSNAARRELMQSAPKVKIKRTDFEDLCRRRPSEIRNQGADESFLRFSLLSRRLRNLIKRATSNVRTGNSQSNIPIEKVTNLSNVIRAYASERLSSVLTPAQGSLFPSPCTPQNLLRSLQMPQFTPIRGDGSSQLPGSEMEQINFQTRSLVRQQTLLTIPEKDFLVARPTDVLDEDLPFRNSLTNIMQLAENVQANELNIDEEQINLALIAENAEEQNLSAPVQVSDLQLIEQLEINISREQIIENNVPPPPENQMDENRPNWFDILRSREDIVYPNAGREKRKRRKRKRQKRRNSPPRSNPEVDSFTVPDSVPFPIVPEDFTEQVTQDPAPSNHSQLNIELKAYIHFIKKGMHNPERTWERFDPFLFNENDDFEIYTTIFKRMLTGELVSFNTLYMEGTSRMDAARGFRFLLELQAMGLIEIVATGTRIESFKYLSPI